MHFGVKDVVKESHVEEIPGNATKSYLSDFSKRKVLVVTPESKFDPVHIFMVLLTNKPFIIVMLLHFMSMNGTKDKRLE